MTPANVLVLAILVGALILFVTEKVRVDVVALLVLVALLFARLVGVEEAFAGFASPAVVTVWAVFIISGALERSGVADLMARALMRLAGSSEQRLLFWLMLIVGLMSAFMNNVGAVAILMPAVITIGRKLSIASSKLLMPLAFAALMGGNLTLIGTPPNLLAVGIMAERGLTPFAFFDFAPTGAVVLIAGIAYMMLIGRRLLPVRNGGGALSNQYQIKEFLAEVRVGERSPLVGSRLDATDLGERYGVTILYLRNTDGTLRSPLASGAIAVGDVLLVEGTPEDLLRLQRDKRLQVVEDWRADKWHPELDADEFHLAEVTLAPNSRLENRTLRDINFRRQYGLSVLALRHQGREQVDHLSTVPLSFGDSLLVQGPTDNLTSLSADPDLLVLEQPLVQLRRTAKAPVALAIVVLVLVGAAAGVYPVAALMVAGALLMVLTGVLTMDEAYRAIDWKSIFLIAGMLPLGTAMDQTGTARLLADQLVAATGQWGPLVVLGCLFALTALLTEVISNAAATVLVVPIAIDVAFGLGAAPQPFVMATVIAASTSFLMPVGHQVNVLVFGAGGYRFSDYTKVGIGLNVLLLALTVTVVPLVWPLFGR